MQHSTLLSTAEAAQELGIDRSTLTRWVAAGHIKPSFQGKGTRAPMFFASEDVEQLKSQTETVTRTVVKASAS